MSEMAEPVMENPLAASPRSPKVTLAKTVNDVQECVEELKHDYTETGEPITDDSQTLQRLSAKLEFLLQAGLKTKTGLLGGKKDYWNYFCDCMSSNKGLGDGIKFVKSLSELRTPLGRGRALIRFCLVHQRLADTLQQCVCDGKATSEWYHSKAIWLQHDMASSVISTLYDLNDVQFDLSPRGYDLDAAWPSFARKPYGSWRPPSRTTSISSLTSNSTQDLSASFVSSSPVPEFQEEQLRQELNESENERLGLTYQVASLTKESQDARTRSQDLQGQLDSLQATCNEYKVRCGKLESELELKEEVWQEKEKLLQTQVDEAKTAKEEVKEQLSSLGVETFAQLKASMTDSSALRESNAELLHQKASIEQENKSLQEEVASLNKGGQELQEQVESLEKERNSLQEQVSTMEKKQAEQEEHVVTMDKQLRAIMGEVEGQADVDAKKNHLIELLEAKVTKSAAKVKELEEKYIAEVQEREKALTAQLDYAKKVKEMGKQLEQEAAYRQKLQASHDELKEMLQGLEEKSKVIATTAKDKVNEYTDRNKQLQEQVSNLETQLQEKEGRISELEGQTKIHQQGATESINSLTEELTQLKTYLNDKEANLTDTKEQVEALLKERTELSGKLTNEQKHTAELQQLITDLTSSRESTEADLNSSKEKLEQQVQELIEKLEAQTSEVARLKNEKEKIEGEFSAAKVANVEQQGQISTLEAREDENKMLLEQTKVQLTQKDRELEQLTAELHNLKTAFNQFSTDTTDEVDVKEEESNPLMAKVKAVVKEKQFLATQLQSAEAKQTELKQQVSSYEQQVASMQEEITKGHLEAAELKTLISQSEIQVADLSSKVETLQSEAELNRKELEEKQQILDNQEAQLQQFNQQHTQLKAKLQEREEELTSATSISETLRQDLAASKAECEQFKAENSSLMQEKEAMNSQVTEKTRLVASHSTELTDLRLQIDELTKRQDLLHEELEARAYEKATLEKRLEEQEEAYEVAQQERLEVLQGQLEKEKEMRKDIEQEVKQLQALREANIKQITLLEASKKEAELEKDNTEVQLQKDIDGLIIESGQLKFQIEQLSKENETLLGEHQRLVAEVEKLTSELDEAKKTGEEVRQDREELAADHKQLQQRMDMASSELDTATATMTAKDIEIEGLHDQMRALEAEKAELQLEVQSAQQEKEKVTESLQASSGEMEQQLVRLAAEKLASHEESSKMKKEVERLRQEMEKLTAEIKQAREMQNNTEKEAANEKDALQKEISALTFKLSSQELEYKNSVKLHTDQTAELECLAQKVDEQQALVDSMEIEMRETRNQHMLEQEQQCAEIEELRHSLSQQEEECTLLHDELKRNKNLLEEERNSVIKYKNELTERTQEHKAAIMEKNTEIEQLRIDVSQLKKKLIQLVKEKDSLWQRTDQLEFQQKVKAMGRWMEDKHVTHCLGCNLEFTFTIRRHHCRQCGGIFCSSCSDNWLLMTHSSKKERACNACFKTYQEVAYKAGGSEAPPGSENGSQGDKGSESEEEVNRRSQQLPDGDPQPGTSSQADESFHDDHMGVDGQRGLLDDVNSGDDNIAAHIHQTDDNKARALRKTAPPGGRNVEQRQSSGDEGFDVITQDEIADSMYEQTVPDDPRMQGNMLYTVEQLTQLGVATPDDELWIKAGKTYAVIVDIAQPGVTFCWEFTTQPKGISFAATYRGLGVDASDAEQLIPLCKCNSHHEPVRGELVARKSGLYTLLFDNTGSRMTSKKLEYRVSVRS